MSDAVLTNRFMPRIRTRFHMESTGAERSPQIRTLTYLCGPDPWIAGFNNVLVVHFAEYENGDIVNEYLFVEECVAEDLVHLWDDGTPTDISSMKEEDLTELFAAASHGVQPWQIEAAEDFQTAATRLSLKECAVKALHEDGLGPRLISNQLPISKREVKEVLSELGRLEV